MLSTMKRLIEDVPIRYFTFSKIQRYPTGRLLDHRPKSGHRSPDRGKLNRPGPLFRPIISSIRKWRSSIWGFASNQSGLWLATDQTTAWPRSGIPHSWNWAVIRSPSVWSESGLFELINERTTLVILKAWLVFLYLYCSKFSIYAHSKNKF